MPGLRLECSVDGDVERLRVHLAKIHGYLAEASKDALHLPTDPGIWGVSVRLVFAPGFNVPRVDVQPEVSEDKTPAPQDMEAWGIALLQAWQRMRADPELSEILDILEAETGFWPRIAMKGKYLTLNAVR